MTKNRFLSKRLACLLTTALISSTILPSQAFSADQLFDGVTAGQTVVDADVLTAAAGSDLIISGGTVTTAIAITALQISDIKMNGTTASALTVANTGAITIASTFDVNTGRVGTLNVQFGTAETPPDAVTFSGAIASTGTSTIAVGSATTAGNANFTRVGALVADTITITGGNHVDEDSTLSAQNAVTATSITLDDNLGGATLVLGTNVAVTIAGTINGAAAGEGIVQVTGTGKTFTGAVGGSTAIKLLDIAQTATFSSSVNATGIAVATATNLNVAGNVTVGAAKAVLTGAAGTLTLNGTAGQTVSGVVEGAGAGQGIIAVTNIHQDGVRFTSAIGTGGAIADLTAATGTRTIFNARANLIQNLDLEGTAAVEFTTSTFANAATLITANATAMTIADVPDTTSIKLPVNFVGGNAMDLFHTVAVNVTNTDGLIILNTAVKDSVLTDYVVTKKGAAAIALVTATDKSTAVTASELGVNTNKAAALLQARNAAIASDSTAMASLDSILKSNTTTGATNFTNQAAPQTDTIAGSTVAAKAVTSGVQNIMSTRLASLRSGDAFSTGVVTGSGMSANSGFIQAFGSTVEQKNKGNEFGYDADTTGFALGVDGKVSDGVVVGISYANSKTDVDGKGTGKAKNDIKTNSGSIYADYTTKDGYIEGSITYGKSDNKGSRSITEGLTRTYASNYDSEQYSFRLSGGVPVNLGKGAFFTPFAGATISQIKTDAYTETSNTADDSLRLRVAQDTVDSQVGTIGIKYHQAIKDGKTTFTPEVKLAVNQEFGDDTITSTNTYQGGGTSFKNSTAIEKTSATAGAGLNISSDNVSFNIGYEADVRDKYLGHSAQAKITAKF